MALPEARSAFVGVVHPLSRSSIFELLGSFRLHLGLLGYESLMVQQEKYPHLPFSIRFSRSSGVV